MLFRRAWCDHCERERLYREYEVHGHLGSRSQGYVTCPILNAALFYAVDDPRYPKEWVYDPEAMKREGALNFGQNRARCTAFEFEAEVKS